VPKRTTRTISNIAALAILCAGAASAAELKVLSGGAMRAAVQELAGTFETSSGQLVIEYGTVAKVAEKVARDDPIDVAILTQPFFRSACEQRENGRRHDGTAGACAYRGGCQAGNTEARYQLSCGVQEGAARRHIDHLWRSGHRGRGRRSHGQDHGSARPFWQAATEDPSHFTATRPERGQYLTGL
jgi:hypothetical protein